jgi:hypothetical protein
LYYLNHKTLEFFIYFLFQKEPCDIKLDQFDPKLVDTVFQDIQYKELKSFFVFKTFLNFPTQLDKISEIDYLLELVNKDMGPYYNGFHKINKTLDIIHTFVSIFV